MCFKQQKAMLFVLLLGLVFSMLMSVSKASEIAPFDLGALQYDQKITRFAKEYDAATKEHRYSEAERNARSFLSENSADTKAAIAGHYYLAIALMNRSATATTDNEKRVLRNDALTEFAITSSTLAALDPGQSKADYARIMDDLPLLRAFLLVEHEDGDRSSEGLFAAREIVKQKPDSERGRLAVGCLLKHAKIKKRDQTDVLKELSAIANKHPGTIAGSFALYNLGRTYAAMGNAEGLEMVKNKMSEEYPDNLYTEDLNAQRLRAATQTPEFGTKKH